MLVAARRAAQRRQPQAPDDDVLAGLRPGRDLDLALAVEGRDGHRAAEHRPGGGQLDDRNQLLAVALEPLVLGDQHLHVEVPGPSTGISPACPAPEIRIRWPDSIPGGTSTSQARMRTVRPCPPHSSQGVSGTRPWPPQVGQAPVRTT